jgi:hypothetical protein
MLPEGGEGVLQNPELRKNGKVNRSTSPLLKNCSIKGSKQNITRVVLITSTWGETDAFANGRGVNLKMSCLSPDAGH